MNKKWLYGVCIFLIALTIVGSNFVDKSLSASNYTIDTPGTYYLPKGTNVSLSGISCSTTYDYTSTPAMTTMVTDCGGTGLTIPTAQDDYLLVVEDTGSTCSGQMVGSPSKIDAVCKIYPYNAGSVSIQCNRNKINAGEKASCTIKTVTSSDGIKALSFVANSKDLVLKNFESNFFEAIPSNNFVTFVAKKELKTQTEYLVAAFDLENVGDGNGVANTISFDSISYTDNTTMLDLGSVSLTFAEDLVTTTTEVTTKQQTTAKKNNNNNNNNNTTTENTTVSTVVTAGIEEELPKEDGNGSLVFESDTAPKEPTEGKPSLSGSTAVILTVFVATMSIATGIGISIFFAKIKP